VAPEERLKLETRRALNLKLNEIIAKTNTLASNGKITAGADAIITSAQNAIACVQAE
jgi:hypothetical protein